MRSFSWIERVPYLDRKEFHDEFMAAGRLPIALIHWEMTGNDEGIADLWLREPLPAD